MEVIHDRAYKFINDVYKKKIKEGKIIYKDSKEHVKQDTVHVSDLSNSCYYCRKIFFNSRFLRSHVLRRHSEDLLSLYKNCPKHELNDNPSDMKNLYAFLEKELLELKNELKVVKQAVVNENEGAKHDKNMESNENKVKINEDVTEIHSNELKFLKGKVCDMEHNIQGLHNKFEELDNVIKTDVLLKQDFEGHIFNNEKIHSSHESQYITLRQTLKDLQTMLFRQLDENTNEWKSQISERKDEIKRIDHIIAAIQKQVSSPDYIKTLEERLELQIINFLGNPKRSNRRSKNLKSKIKSPETKVNCSSQGKVFECNKFNKEVAVFPKPQQAVAMSHISTDKLSFMIAEKLSHFNLAPNCSKISCAEFDEKLQLVNVEMEHLEKKHPKFSEVRNDINMSVDHKANHKQRNKKSRKLRFAEPLTSSANIYRELVSVDENFHNKTDPLLHSDNQEFANKNQKPSDQECEEFAAVQEQKCIPKNKELTLPDNGGMGDCSWNFPTKQDCLFKQALEPMNVKSSSGFNVSCVDIQGYQRDATIYSKNSNLTNSKSLHFNKTLDYGKVELQNNSVCFLKDYPKQDKKNSFIKDFEELKNSNDNSDEDLSSLKSLSSWEN